MSWTERLRIEIGWDRPRENVDWTAVESLLGLALPGSYKDYAEAFGWGEFNGAIEVFGAVGDISHGGIVGESKKRSELADLDQEFESMYAPYSVFPNPGGLMIWGVTGRGDSLFWETRGEISERWPIVAITEDGRSFSYGMEVSEFLYGCVVSGDIRPFSAVSRGYASGFMPIESYE
ncbi:hypothetical protein PUR61_00100 [Streptomyces sp. BE20]|uniref:SMI1/KNR4 family protein n=1 Tax=unclassified Streptomyces TaxID=2593676 RepID=UPI002E7978A2|nr:MULTISPECIES: SMI1/KNR4 family protein [unclassified Streptomyces]MED7949662.1 hypothetical protein [Streptomyces sp. BE303]MEE1820623.1 hypothetical protein [Streptomyces sp. BE20]